MDIEKIKTQMCDNYCKHFEEIRATFEDIDRGQEELDRICEHCPLNELEVAEWIPFKMRPLTKEEEEMYPDWTFMMDCDTPEDEEEILVSNGNFVWADTWYSWDFCCLDSDHELDGCAWMSFPEPWKGETDEQIR